MLQADFEAWIAEMEREVKRPPAPPKRRQPRVKRFVSPRQRRALSQTPNPVRAAYVVESYSSLTPLAPSDFVGTKEVGPNDRYNRQSDYRAGKATNNR